MDKSQIRQQIITLNEKISSRINAWKNSIDDMPQIEVDFLKEKLRTLYDCLCELEKKENKNIYYAEKSESPMQPETMMAKAILMNEEKPAEKKQELKNHGTPEPEIKPVFEEATQSRGGRQRIRNAANVAAMYDEIKVVG